MTDNTQHEALRFTKKPVTIEAIQWTGENLREVITFTDGHTDTRSHHAGMAWEAYADLVARDGLKIYTLEGKMLANVGDWIIRGVKGEFYPCKPDIFEASYSPAALVEAQQAAPSAAVALSDDLRDRLVAISEAVADQDDRAAQAMLREILAAPQPSPTAQADSQPAVDESYKQALGSKNCMQCCVSYMLGLPLESVPEFATAGGWDRFASFAESQGYAAVMLPGNREFEADYLASGTTARGTSHMVGMNDGKLVHDPHPSNAGLVEVQCVWLLAKKATPQRHHDERAAFEASAKAYTSNVRFERDEHDYADMTASLLWHGWKLRAARAPADSVLEDAARYRMLRRGQHWSVINGVGDTLRAEELDAAIDAARSKAKEGGAA